MKKAALIRRHSTISEIINDTLKGEISQIFYHRQCKGTFILKRSEREISTLNVEKTSTKTRQLIRHNATTSSSVLEKKYLFCEKKDKYLKGSRTKDSLTQAKELYVDDTVRKVSDKKCDNRILAN